MPDTYSTALSLSRLLLQLMRALNLAMGAALVCALAASFVWEPVIRDFFIKAPERADPGMLMAVLRVWVLLAAPVIAAVHIQLSRLLDMAATVRAGDPFVPENAVRMKTIAWCLLVIQIFDLVNGFMVSLMNAAGSRMDWSFSATGWLALVLLFVLARVFEEGTRIRADLGAMI